MTICLILSIMFIYLFSTPLYNVFILNKEYIYNPFDFSEVDMLVSEIEANEEEIEENKGYHWIVPDINP